MDNDKDDLYYLGKIVSDLKFIYEHMESTTYEEFISDDIKMDSMMFRIVQISENCKKLSGSFKKEHNSVPWQQIIGLRNKLVHEYNMVDLNVVYISLTRDVPHVYQILSNLEI
ncbi:MAG: DUF86 domain-containing protein [Coprobacillus sp.]|nr:DUF86 domain-containing protein [Coprobacillus sp.]